MLTYLVFLLKCIMLIENLFHKIGFSLILFFFSKKVSNFRRTDW